MVEKNKKNRNKMILCNVLVAVLLLAIGIAVGASLDSKEPETNEIKSGNYNVSTDYHRLWNSLVEGRRVILLDYDEDELWSCRVARFYTDSRGEHIVWGFGSDNDNIGNCNEEEFVHYCSWKKVKFLDQVDEYDKK
jgi:hypothetical protein